MTPARQRDHAMLAMLIGCGLRRGELLALTLESVQQREEHWVIADLVGKGGHVRTVPIPLWVKSAVDAGRRAAITQGRVFRAINKAGRIWGDGMSPKVLWDVVRVRRHTPASRNSHRMISAARAPGCVTLRVANSIRSSSSGPRLHSNDGAIPRVQAEAPMRRERPARH